MLNQYLNNFFKNFKNSKNEKFLLLIRKGESLANMSGLICGQLDCKITPKGRQQAHLYFEPLFPHLNNFNNFYCSDLKRCKEFSEVAWGFNNKIKVNYSSLLRERDFGEDEGVFYDGLNSEEKKKYFDPDYVPKNGGENWYDVKNRSMNFLEKEIQKNTINLIFTHGGLINSMLTPIENFKEKNPESKYYIDIASCIGVSFDEKNQNQKVHFIFENIEE